MATFGLKKQGRMWGLFHGAALVRGHTLREAEQRRGDTGSQDGTRDGAAGEQEPSYDNDQEYSNFKTALQEVKRHPALEAADLQEKRMQLQQELEALAAAFEAKHGRGQAIAWDAAAEAELLVLQGCLEELLGLVGLSLQAA
jgi:hypothetical protein